MFRREKQKESGANRLKIEATPNTLSWAPADATAEDEDFEAVEEPEADEDELEPEDEEVDEDPAAVARREAELQAELQRQAEEYGLTNDDPKGLYGPNGDEVAVVLDALDELGPRKAERLADAWEAVDQAEREVVERILGRRHRGGSHQYELSAAEDAVSAWLAAKLSDDAAMEDLWREVAQAANDAATAIILDEELSDADYETLYGPWAEVMDTDAVAADEDAASEAAATAGKAEGSDSEDEEVGEFGPNTSLVLEFLEKLANLDPTQIPELVTVWRDQPKEELKTAHRNLQSLADEDETWREQLRLAQEEIFSWMDYSATKYHDHSLVTRDKARSREVAGPAVADAVAALVMADILEREDAAILFAPWADVVGTPELPAFEEDDDA
ncbi:MAG: hypothetical protein ACHQ01_02890 [Candidatus Limnocylindrales bacterium]